MADKPPSDGQTLRELFIEWGVTDDIIKVFVDNGITINLLKSLTDEYLKELCGHMATRIMIKTKIDEFLKSSPCSSIDVRAEINSSALICSQCGHSSADCEIYISHLEDDHEITNFFSCPIRDCFRTYHSRYSFQYHLKHGHQTKKPDHFRRNSDTIDTFTQRNFDGISLPSPNYDYSIPNTSGNDHELDNPVQSHNSNHGTESYVSDNIFFSQVEEFISHLYNIIDIPRSLIQTLYTLVESLMSSFATAIWKILCHSEDELDPKYENVSSIINNMKTAFATLNTDYKRMKHFTHSKCYVRPEPVSIGTIRKEKTVENKVIMTVKEKFVYIIPLEKNLKLFLELPGVFSKISNYQKSLLKSDDEENKILQNIIQGNLWKSIVEKYDADQILFPIVIFFDDFETGNPLGSRAGKNKLGATYASIATVPPNLASRLENIFLVLLFYSHDRSYFGNKLIFKRLISELKKLETIGIDIIVENEKLNIKFIMITMAGDNLGLHSIQGFFESFNANNFCRICLTSKNDTKTQTSENPEKIRKIADYESHIENQMGVKESCIWHDLPYFHVYNNWSCDVMHDLMEGIHRYSMPLIISYLIRKKYFTLEQLNSRIKYFLYGNSDTVIPPINNNHLNNKYIIISASEMLSLVRNFCLIIGDSVKEDDEVWQYYHLLLEITEILTSQTLTDQTLEYLKTLISEHHQKFLDIFDEQLKPKFHFLLHYDKIIEKVGPPILISSYKFENKHTELKKVCNSITSRRQIPLSVAIRCQLKACCRYLSKKGLNDSISYSKTPHQSFICDTEYSVDWYEINGIKYKVNMAIMYKFDEFDEPILYLIDDIHINNADDSIVKFDCSLLKILTFNSHFKAYNIIKSRERKKIPINDCNSHPLMIHNIDDKLYISLIKI